MPENDNAVTVQFKLTPDEFITGLMLKGRLKPYKRRSIFQTVVAALAAGYMLYNISVQPDGIQHYIILLVCVLLIALSWIVPKRTEAVMIRETMDTGVQELTVADEYIRLSGEKGRSIRINIADIAGFKQKSGVIFIISKKFTDITIPLRALSDGEIRYLDDILAKALPSAAN